MFSLKDKKILITGASRGLGSVCATTFSVDSARLVLMARSETDLNRLQKKCANPSHHLVIPIDLTDFKWLPDAMTKAIDFCNGEIDCVLHVAGGGLGLRNPLLSADEIMKLFSLNVAAAVEINRFIAPRMLKRGKGNLVHVASVSAGEANASVGYNTVKAALAAYVRSLGNELAASGVVATGILPGGFRAPGNSWERLEAKNPEIVARFIKDHLPRNRLADAEEIVPLLKFLCSDAASMMGGCMVPVDAGEGKTYSPV